MKKATLILLLFAMRCSAAAYFMGPSGNDSHDGSNNTTQAWATPNHALNCGDTLTASAGAYNGNAFTFGTVTCASANNVAWLLCATPFACSSTVSSGGQYAQGLGIGKSYWGIQGWVVSTYSGGGACISVIPGTTNTTIHHILIANNIMNGCGQAGISFSTNGTGGVDYVAAIGNIVYNAVQGSALCTSGINSFNATASDSLPGTHYYFAGNFTWGNVEPNPCNSQTPTDGQGLFLDDVQPYAQQMVIDNNISVFNGGAGIKVYNNSTGTPNARIYIRHNTTYGNNGGAVNGGVCGEIELQSSLSSEVYLNLSQTVAATACSGPLNNYVLAVQSGNSTDILYSGYGYSEAGNNTLSGGATFTGNTFANPIFSNPVQPSAPSCSAYTTTAVCMTSVIANFTPTAAAAFRYGYQVPSNTSRYDPLYPQWLCGVANLPTGLVTPGCMAGMNWN